MERLRVAVVGAGRLGGFHAAKLASLADVEVVAVVDPSPDAGRRVVESMSGTPVMFETLDAMFDGGVAVDAAVVATPTLFHADATRRLLERSVHCLVEKPMTPTAREADEMTELARQRGLVLAAGHTEEFNPAWVTLLERLDLADRPRYIFCRRASDYTFRSTDVGVVLDLMIHDLELVLRLTRRPPVRVESQRWNVVGGHEDVATARLAFDDGCTAVLEASRVRPEPERRMELWYTDVQVMLDFSARRYTLTRRSDALRRGELNFAECGGDPASQREWLLTKHLVRETDESGAVDAIAEEDRDFVDAIRQRRSPRTDGRAAADAIRLAEEILQVKQLP